jgi:putative hydrolase of the HAD superfamily
MRNVIMDLGGVLLEWNPDRILEPFQPDPLLRTQLRATLFGHPDWRQFDRGTLTESELLDRLQQRTGRSRDEFVAIIDAVRHALLAKPDVVELVMGLRQRGFDLYCLSNMPAPIYAHLRERHGFWHVFRGIVISGEIQLMKPEPEVFLHLLDRFGLQAQESVFVDDLEVNVEAARAVGLHAILFRSTAQCQQELDELLLS